DSILYAPDLLTSEFARDLIARVDPSAPQPVSAQVMESLANKENPQGILAIVHQKQARLDELPPFRMAVAIVSPQDPGNVGAILRTLDAVGGGVLFIIDGGVEPYHPTAVRASMGTLFWKPLIRTSFSEFFAWTRNGNYQLIGTSAKAETDYRSLAPKVPWILLLGNEQKGLSAAHLAACDVTVSLPMRGRVSSLNLAVSAGILLYALNE
ncbi:MAG: RNA methyltransferase, partial [Anaerolineales bacterium]|nr:RNA methyltransferase [Anaerolineales bacterium]